MRLFQFSYSPYAAKLRIVLKLKGLAYEPVEVPYTKRHELVAATGGIGIPVLVDGDQVITDSPRIVEYLELKGGPPLRADPLALVLEQWADELFEEAAFRLACPGLEDRMGREQGEEARLMFRLVKERRYGAGAVAQWRSEHANHLAKTTALLQPIIQTLAARPFLLGPTVTVADAAVAGQLSMLEAAEAGWVRAHAPSLLGWYERLSA